MATSNAPDTALFPLGKVAAPAILFLLSRLAILVWFPAISSDTLTYCAYAIKGVDLGEVAYADFAVEYPPISYWAICLPRLWSRTPYPYDHFKNEIPAAVFHDYRWSFRCTMFVADAAAFALFVLIAGRIRPMSLPWAAWGYALVGLALAPVVYDRLDVGLSMLLMLWAYAAVRARESCTRAFAWDALACAALGLAIGFKWAPIVVTPYFLFGMLDSTGGWKRIFVGGAIITLVAALPFIAHLPGAGSGVWQLLAYHAQRATEIESVYASAMMALSAINSDVVVQAELGGGSWDLAGPWSERLAQLSIGLLLLGYVALAILAWLRRRELDRHLGLQLAGFALLFTITFSKVLSPQYLIWLLPLMLVLALEDLRPYALLVVILVMIAFLTTWIFPFHFLQARHPETGQMLVPLALLQGLDPARSIHPVTASVLGARNLLLLGVTAWLGWRLLTTRRPAPGD